MKRNETNGQMSRLQAEKFASTILMEAVKRAMLELCGIELIKCELQYRTETGYAVHELEFDTRRRK